jgi:hypothetical protein
MHFFLTVLQMFCTDFLVLLCYMVSIFCTHCALTFLQPSFLMMAKNASFQSLLCHNSLGMMLQSSKISTSTLSFVSVVTTMAGQLLLGPSTKSFLFTTLKTMQPASNCNNISGILIIHTSQMSMCLYQTGAFHSKKIKHHPLPSTHFHICHFSLLLC